MTRIQIVALGVLLASVATAAGQGPARAFRFDKAAAGKLPPGWQAAHTGAGGAGVWKVVADVTGPAKTAYVLAQAGVSPNRVFNLCVAADTKYQDVEIEVAFKAVAGEKDQGGGVVWRYQDADNYYVARMNPLEDNYRIYKVIGGKRIQLATKEGLKIPVGEWHRLRVRQVGGWVECFLDGAKLLEARDTALAGAGRVGLWTKADARTRFDGFRVGPPRKE